MAEGDVTPSEVDSDFGGSSSGGPGGWISQHKGAAAGAGLVLLVAGYLFLKHRAAASSGSGGSVGTGTGPAVYEIAPGYLSGGSSGGGGGVPYGAAAQYGSYIGADQGLASQTQTGQTGGTVGGAGTPSSGSSYAGSVNSNAGNTGTSPTAPSAPAADPLAGLTYIPTYSQFQSDVKAGQTVDYVPAGGGSPVPFAGGGKVYGTAPSGSRWYTTG